MFYTGKHKKLTVSSYKKQIPVAQTPPSGRVGTVSPINLQVFDRCPGDVTTHEASEDGHWLAGVLNTDLLF